MSKEKLKCEITFDFPSYDEDISEAIKDQIIEEVRKEVRKQAKGLREIVAKKIQANQAQLVESAMKALGE